MNAGGAETFMMKLYRAMDRGEYQMDFCVTVEENFYREEIERLGGRIFVIPQKSKNPITSFKALSGIVRDGGYESVIRVNEHSLSTLDLLAARAGGARRLSMRSSNASSGGGLSGALHKLFRPLTTIVPDVRIAPSKLAAEYSFGKGCVESGRATLLPNGLDLGLYAYDAAARESLRRSLGVPDGALLVGHVGRFNAQKNHAFLLDVFAAILEARPDAVLALVGKGDLENEIASQVESLGIAGSVRMLGVRSDVPALLSAFDVLAFPSLYEGMPNVVIEAQAAGLPCVVSDEITREANVTGRVSYLPIDDARAWAVPVLEASCGRYDGMPALRDAGYDINEEVGRFVELVYT